jgi:hypothetical protein
MVQAIVCSAVGLWVFVFVLVLGLCRDAKAGDHALEVLSRPQPGGRPERSGGEALPRVGARARKHALERGTHARVELAPRAPAQVG